MSSISYVQCFIDGAVRNNGLPNATSACAGIIYNKKKEVLRFARLLSSNSNNEAEYEALIHVLLLCYAKDYDRPMIYSDSTLVVNHTNNVWECKTPSLLPFYMTVKEIQKVYSFDIYHVPRAKVWLPDQLCNTELDKLETKRNLMTLEREHKLNATR